MAQRFSIDGRVWQSCDADFQRALEGAFESENRPLCLCVAGGVPMYVARHGAWLIKRMPSTAPRHHPSCPSFELSPGSTGVGAHWGRAIREVSTGLALRLSFGLRPQADSHRGATGVIHERVAATQASRGLSLQGLMHLLFDRARLNRWDLGRWGRRSQSTLYAELMVAAQGCRLSRGGLAQRLLVPEPFVKENLPQSAARRINKLRLLGCERALVLGEFKAAEAVGERVRIWVRHWPDWPLWASAEVWRRFERTHARVFEARQTSQTLRMMVMAVIEPIRSDTYRIQSICPMLTTEQWIPLHASHEEPLVKHLVSEGRSFIKPLRYDTDAAEFANVLLLDVGNEAVPLHVLSPFMSEKEQQRKHQALTTRQGDWVWDMSLPMPALAKVGEGQDAAT